MARGERAGSQARQRLTLERARLSEKTSSFEKKKSATHRVRRSRHALTNRTLTNHALTDHALTDHALINHRLTARRGSATQAKSTARCAERWWNAKLRTWIDGRRKGTVFPDRYHADILATPTQVRNALCYVLNNWRKHREDQRELAAGWLVDPFSSGWAFGGWTERGDSPFAWKTRDTYEPMLTAYPQTWLLREGWKRGGGPTSVHAVPSARSARA